MKTLANCSPKEFLVQTNKIRRYAETWLSLTKIMEIRKNLPKITDDMTAEEKREALNEQVKTNANHLLNAVLEEYPEETAVLLGLVCFIEPEDIEKHTMAELLGAYAEIIANKEVISFFISLMQLGQMNI